jgi:hypothetical protein
VGEINIDRVEPESKRIEAGGTNRRGFGGGQREGEQIQRRRGDRRPWTRRKVADQADDDRAT